VGIVSGLADRLISEMAGHEVHTASMTIRQKAEELKRTVGVTKGAALAGVDRRTFQRWFQKWEAGKDHKPRSTSLDKLDLGVRHAWTANTVPDAGWSIRVQDRNDPHRAERTISMGQLKLSPGTMARVAEVYRQTGNSEAAAAAFLAGVNDRFYRRWLTPPATARDAAPPVPAVGTGGTAGDIEFDEAGAEIPETAYDEFMDAQYDEYADQIPADDSYGGDVA
jgi:hypothetical protein